MSDQHLHHNFNNANVFFSIWWYSVLVHVDLTALYNIERDIININVTFTIVRSSEPVEIKGLILAFCGYF